MATVFIPPMMRDLAGGQHTVEVTGATLREVVRNLDAAFPGFRDLIVQNDHLRPGLALAVNSVLQSTGLMASVPPDAEVHILPAIAGGAGGHRPGVSRERTVEQADRSRKPSAPAGGNPQSPGKWH